MGREDETSRSNRAIRSYRCLIGFRFSFQGSYVAPGSCEMITLRRIYRMLTIVRALRDRLQRAAVSRPAMSTCKRIVSRTANSRPGGA